MYALAIGRNLQIRLAILGFGALQSSQQKRMNRFFDQGTHLAVQEFNSGRKSRLVKMSQCGRGKSQNQGSF